MPRIARKKNNNKATVIAGMNWWNMFFFMYLFTSDTVMPIDKLEFFWRWLAGPINFLPGV